MTKGTLRQRVSGLDGLTAARVVLEHVLKHVLESPWPGAAAVCADLRRELEDSDDAPADVPAEAASPWTPPALYAEIWIKGYIYRVTGLLADGAFLACRWLGPGRLAMPVLFDADTPWSPAPAPATETPPDPTAAKLAELERWVKALEAVMCEGVGGRNIRRAIMAFRAK